MKTYEQEETRARQTKNPRWRTLFTFNITYTVTRNRHKNVTRLVKRKHANKQRKFVDLVYIQKSKRVKNGEKFRFFIKQGKNKLQKAN